MRFFHLTFYNLMKKSKAILQICKTNAFLLASYRQKNRHQHPYYPGKRLEKGRSRDTKTDIHEAFLQKNFKNI